MNFRFALENYRRAVSLLVEALQNLFPTKRITNNKCLVFLIHDKKYKTMIRCFSFQIVIRFCFKKDHISIKFLN